MRAFASEILTLRNLHAHGDPCEGEYGRLVDTGRRLLMLLGICVPEGVGPAPHDGVEVAVAESGVELPSQLPIRIDRWDAEMVPLGEAGEQVGEVLIRAYGLERECMAVSSAALMDLDPRAPDLETFRQKVWSAVSAAGPEVVELLRRLEQLELAGPEPKDPAMSLLFLHGRHVLTTGFLGTACKSHLVDIEQHHLDAIRDAASAIKEAAEHQSGAALEERLKALSATTDETGERVNESRRLVQAMTVGDYTSSVLRVASELDDASPIANAIVAAARFELADATHDEAGHWTPEALPHIQDAVARLRFEAAMEPGSSRETLLVAALRREGEIYVDIDQPEQALQSFARAEEIIDRYPSADPDLSA